jgi:DNA-binding transcriptional ArsR family regulator
MSGVNHPDPARSASAQGAEAAPHDIEAASPDVAARELADIEVIKALAAPIRLRILHALERSSTGEPRVMSAKELAEALGEPQTKLYRHLKVLESAGLIEVAATRLVSGILEQRYRVVQRDYSIGGGFGSAATTPVTESAVSSVMRVWAENYFTAHRQGRIPARDDAEKGPHPRSLLMLSDVKVPAAKAAELRRRLVELADELRGPDDPDGIEVYALLGFYSPAEPGTYPPQEPASS